ncbi:uncharacterized protein FFB20_11677 [Fusarium fujikuroi]|uniref:Uncharacterized protein n=1 Tax=Fusarium fujikuroi TaxID=5127 RepID=A0A2H3RXL2_FUSFU|nr:uncharacterized protein Y057_5642 [Fusarium fujikuroi]SCO02712.1 uncharacterized protein FFB20_11677 [Fusarium fujikuroi]SCO03195.1 uncharacterized protein FFC1_09236 [Fusarium fujikuroi]SCO35498.1 uncharacterized protein FFNC_04514 [Fusarium fujikuroi]VTT55203.1 unnamed protein product [Fusarium fujikuroi]
MRFAAFLPLGLGANIAIASVCKPRSRTSSDSSTVSTEPVSTSTGSIALSTTTTDVMAESTTSDELSISITFTDDGKTSTEATESQSASVELSASTATETATTEIPTTTAETTATAEVTTSAEATTTYETTATEDTFVPIPTFNIKALGSDIDGQLLRGDPVIYNNIGWYTPSPPVLTLSIEDNTNYVREINTGKYLCVAFGGDGFPNSNMLCNPDSHYAGIEPITCEQTRDRKLKCTAPAGECHLDESSDTTNCWTVSGTWDKFYVIHGRIINTPALVMASSSDLSTPNDMEAIELQLVPYAD